MNKRVLLICYYFPPLGLAGIARPLHLCRRLPGHGYECHVLTVKPVLYRAYEPELLEGLDLSRIHRSGSYDPQRLLYLLGKRSIQQATISRGKPVSQRMFPDSKKGWIGPAVRLGKKLLNDHEYNAIISTSPPMSAHVVGLALQQSSGLPWVADFRDFWSMYKVEETFEDPSLIARGQAFLKDLKAAVEAVTAVNPAIVDYLQMGTVITNGYDPELADRWRLPYNFDHFRIGIPGNLGEERVLAPLFEIVKRLRSQAPDLFEKLELVQLGQVEEPWLQQLFDSHGLAGKYIIHNRQPRAKTIDLLSECSLFYIGLTSDKEQGILPQRLFDLAASGRPILAYASHDSEIASFVQAINNGWVFDDQATDAAVRFVEDKMTRWSQDKLAIAPRPAYAAPYSAETMVGAFAELLDEIV